MAFDFSKLTADQKRALSEASRILSAADGIPQPQAVEALVKQPGRLKAIASRIDQTADALAGLFDEPEADTAAETAATEPADA